MNKMRYPKSNAKDDAEHSHPTEISSASVHAKSQKSPLLPIEHRNIQRICIYLRSCRISLLHSLGALAE